MQQRVFGTTGQKVSDIGLGTWQLGGTEWGKVGDDEAMATLRAAAGAGITFIDTADIYGGGRSEEFIGRFLKEHGRRDDFFIATKFGRSSDPGWPENFRPETIRKHVDGSLRRLQIERIDLLQSHCVPMEHLKDGVGLGNAAGASGRRKIAGLWSQRRIDGRSTRVCGSRWPGFTANHFQSVSVEAGRGAVSHGKEPKHCFNRPIAAGQRIAVGQDYERNRFCRKRSSLVQSQRREIQCWRDVCRADTGCSPAAGGKTSATRAEENVAGPVGMRWCLDHEEITVVIPGSRRPEQVRENSAASDLKRLSSKTHAAVFELYYESVRDNIRGVY